MLYALRLFLNPVSRRNRIGMHRICNKLNIISEQKSTLGFSGNGHNILSRYYVGISYYYEGHYYENLDELTLVIIGNLLNIGN